MGGFRCRARADWPGGAVDYCAINRAKQPPEYRQYATLLAPGDIAWSAISLACGLYLTRTPHRLGTAGTVKQLRGSAKRLMVINGFILVGVLIYIPKIATSLQAGGSQFGLQAACMLGALFLCTVNVMSLNWLNKKA